MDDLRTLARELVEIPSHEDPSAAGDHLETWLETETEATVRRDPEGNVLARRGEGSPDLAFVGHHDVVPPDSDQVEDGTYVVREEDGRLYGRGSADMKGALAAMAVAFREATPVGTLRFASFVGEEQGGIGARAAIDRGYVPEFALVAEGSTGYSSSGVTDIAVTHRGRRASTIEASGTAAHASEPEAGTNAVYRACEAIETLRGAPVPATTVLGQDVEGSVAVTGIEGGSAWNVIPDSCSVTVDERTVPDARLSLDHVKDIPGVSVTIDQDLPPMACTDAAFAEAALGAASEAQSGTPEQVVKPHATDAGWLAEAGSTCLVCGPAEPGEAHTSDESVSLGVLDRCAEIYREVAEQWDPDAVR